MPQRAAVGAPSPLDQLGDTDLCEDCEEVVSDYFCNACQGMYSCFTLAQLPTIEDVRRSECMHQPCVEYRLRVAQQRHMLMQDADG
jgi:hypothetical protein